MSQTETDPDVARTPPPRQKTNAEKLEETELAGRALKLRFLQDNRQAVERANALTRWRPGGGG
jgi:hypothetical protein